MYYYVPHTGKFQQSARPMTRAASYVPSSRRSYDDEVLFTPYRPYSHRYDTLGYDNFSRSQVNKELIMSSAAMEDNFDISNRSRQRDRDVLAAANRAIATSEQFSSPRAAVAARRAMRGHSTPPGPVPTSAYISQSECPAAYSKRIQDVDGPKRPSIMSWQYRIDAYTPPEDLVHVPRSLGTLKGQLRDCKDKLDRHRQLMDRYLVTDTGLSADDMQVVAASKAHLGSRA